MEESQGSEEEATLAAEAIEAEGLASGDVLPPTEEPARSQSLGTTAARGFLWANVGVFARYTSALVLAALLARWLDSAEYRLMVILTTITLYLDTALELGLGAVLVYEQEKGFSRRVQVAFTTNSAFSVVLAVLAVLTAPLVAAVFDLRDFVAIFRVNAVAVFLTGLTAVPWALMTREMAFRSRARTEVVRDFTRVVTTVVLVGAGFGAWGVLFGFICSKAVWWILTWWHVRFRPRLVWDLKILRELSSYAWKRAGNSLLGLLALSGDYFVVGYRATARLDTYYQAFRLPEFALGGQLNAMSTVLFPMYSRIRAEGSKSLKDAMLKALAIVSLVSVPGGIGLALIARDSFGIMFGNFDPDGILTMEILSLTGCVVGLGFATGDLLFATGRPGVMMKLNMVMVPLMLAAMWIVAPSGIVWVAVVHLVTAAVFTLIRQVIVNRMFDATLAECFRAIVPGLVVGLAVAAAALPVRLLTEEGFASLVLIVLAGVVGGAVGILASPGARSEVTEMLTRVRG